MSDTLQTRRPAPISSAIAAAAYAVPGALAPCDLKLDSNEGRAPAVDVDALTPTLLARYPKTRELEAALAARHGVEPSQVIVTAGADDALQRLAAALLAPGRELVLPQPTFEMIERYAAARGATLREVEWPGGPYPTGDVIAACNEATAMVAVVSPNNPTGAIASLEDLQRVAAAAPQAVVVLDHAYAEFADEDLTRAALGLPNVVVLRTFSKAWGLAGLRVGYAIGAPELIGWLRAAGNPYPTAGPSLAIAGAALETGARQLAGVVGRVREEREDLREVLGELGWRPSPSQANFVLARGDDPLWLRDALAGFGVAIRAFPGRARLEDAVRITCPGEAQDLGRLVHGLRTTLRPEALLFDLDGVLADVSRSYRSAILQTATGYGVELAAADITAAKRAGDANDDWSLTWSLLAARGIDARLEEVTERFEALYQGTADAPGLRANESLILSRERLAELGRVLPLGIVTGRPRADAERFLTERGVRDLFQVVVCREDAPLKPNPAPLRSALEALGLERAWYLGDTVDDVRAARAAGLLPLGVVAPGEDVASTRETLGAAGAARTLETLETLFALLP